MKLPPPLVLLLVTACAAEPAYSISTADAERYAQLRCQAVEQCCFDPQPGCVEHWRSTLLSWPDQGEGLVFSEPCLADTLDWMETLSDKRLDEAGMGKSSPVMLFRDGKPLEPHAQPQAYEKACKGAYQHMPKFLFFSPEGSAEDVSGNWSLGLSDDLPMKRGTDGRDVFWVYPGTTMTVTSSGGRPFMPV